jgi:hypothetical protein
VTHEDEAKVGGLLASVMLVMALAAAFLVAIPYALSADVLMTAKANGLEFLVALPVMGFLGIIVLSVSKTWVHQPSQPYTSVNASSRLFFLTKTSWFLAAVVAFAALATLVVDITPLFR